ncbi:MAG: NAD(P)H-hydrate dehydratase [Lachnospiraceae bacterium]|nr:NAD(P)H-hydrate dehydratase [Lachnospiraceae bacterium]
MGERFGNRVVTADQMKKLEGNAIEKQGIPSILLMEHAALAVFEQLKDRRKVLILVGNGKNGGDAVALGRLLLGRGINCDFMTFYEKTECAELLQQWDILDAVGYAYRIFEANGELPNFESYDAIADGVFGIGLNRTVNRDTVTVFNRINEVTKADGKRPFVVAIDIPSGIDATCGKVCGGAVRADVTVSFSYAKTGLLLYPGRAYAGKLIVADIGLPESNERAEYITSNSLRDLGLPKRRPDGNKGDFGKISLVAGCDDMPGAACFCARAMYRSGAGLVRVIGTEKSLSVLHAACPEAVSLTREKAFSSGNPYAGFDNVIVIGPGLGTDGDAQRLLDLAMKNGKKLVLDADALNILAERLDRLNQDPEQRLKLMNEWLSENTIVTPHPGEMSRLLNVPVAELKEDPLLFAKMIRKYCDFVWVWKDACSMVISRRCFYLNQSGNEAMATAGSGDVLSGICGAFAATEMTMAQAAFAAVYVHGLAGDICKDRLGSYGTMAGDIADAVAYALKM